MILDAAEEYNATNDSTVMDKFNDEYLTAMDCANLLLDIVPYENMVWASDYFDDPAVIETP